MFGSVALFVVIFVLRIFRHFPLANDDWCLPIKTHGLPLRRGIRQTVQSVALVTISVFFYFTWKTLCVWLESTLLKSLTIKLIKVYCTFSRYQKKNLSRNVCLSFVKCKRKQIAAFTKSHENVRIKVDDFVRFLRWVDHNYQHLKAN